MDSVNRPAWYNGAAMLENELSFLIAKLPDLAAATREEIEQHYLSDGDEPLRIRAYADHWELTKKLAVAPDDLSRKEEITIPLTREEYEMLRTHSKRSVAKTRCKLPLADGLVAEIDLFRGPLDGLAMVEVEFPDEKSREDFVPPGWFGRDVSQEPWSSNSFLAGKTFEEIKKFI